MNSIKVTLLSVLLTLTAVPAALASNPSVNFDGVKFVIDANVGMQSFNQGTGTKFAYGLGFDARIGADIQVGVEYRRAKLASADGYDLSANSYLGNVLYRLAAGPGTFGIGLEAGETDIDYSADLGIVSATLDSQSEFVVGPKAVYQFMLSEHWEAAANVDYLIMPSSPKLNAFGALASISYSL